MNAEESRGALLLLWERAHASAPTHEWPRITRLYGGDVPPRYAAWAVGTWDDEPDDDRPRQVVALPRLLDQAPARVWHRYLARVVADGTGRCPLCSGVAGLSSEPRAPGEPGRAAFYALPLTVTLRHAAGCPAHFDEADRRWFATTPEEGH